MALSLLLLPVLTPALQDQRISYSAAAKPLSNLLLDLSTRCGVSLSTTPALSQDVVLVQANNASLREIMDHLATTLNGQWKAVDSGYQLFQTKQQAHRDQETDVAVRLQLLQKVLTPRLLQLQQSPSFTNKSAIALAKALHDANAMPSSGQSIPVDADSDLTAQTPLGRALTQLLSAVDGRKLVSVDPGTSLVLSSNPTSTQFPLPTVTQEVFAHLIADQRQWLGALQRESETSDAPTMRQLLREETVSIPTLPSKVILKVTNDPFDQVLHVELLLIGVGDVIMAQTGADFALQESFESSRVESQLSETRFEISADSKAFFEGTSPSTAASLSSRLARPDRDDPLSFLASDFLRKAAGQEHMNLIALLPDSLIRPEIWQGFTPTPRAVSNLLERHGMLNQISNGWWSLTPRRPIACRRDRLNRLALARFIATLRREALPSIENRCSFAATADLTYPKVETVLVLMRFIAPGLFSSSSFQEVEGMKLYGSLTATQREEAKGAGLTYASLRVDQRDSIRHLLIEPPRLTLEPGENRNAFPEERRLFYSGFIKEPTECLPDGIPADTTIHISNQTIPLVFAPLSGSNRTSSTLVGLTAEQYAWQVFVSKRADLFPDPSKVSRTVTIDRIAPGVQTDTTILLRFGNRISQRFALTDQTRDPSRFVAGLDLPADFLSAVAQFTKRFEEKYATGSAVKSIGPDPHGQTPPP